MMTFKFSCSKCELCCCAHAQTHISPGSYLAQQSEPLPAMLAARVNNALSSGYSISDPGPCQYARKSSRWPTRSSSCHPGAVPGSWLPPGSTRATGPPGLGISRCKTSHSLCLFSLFLCFPIKNKSL